MPEMRPPPAAPTAAADCRPSVLTRIKGVKRLDACEWGEFKTLWAEAGKPQKCKSWWLISVAQKADARSTFFRCDIGQFDNQPLLAKQSIWS